MKILLICSWITNIDGLDTALEEHRAQITRVDFEAQLDAALSREKFDLAVFVAASPALTRANVEALVHTHQPRLPLLVAERGEEVVARIVRELQSRRS